MTRQAASVIGIIVSIILFCMGIFLNVPDKKIDFYGSDKYTEYVGGDAYNFQIEASLKGGIIAGAKAEKAIYISVSGLIFVISLFGLTNKKTENQTVFKDAPSTTSLESQDANIPQIENTGEDVIQPNPIE